MPSKGWSKVGALSEEDRKKILDLVESGNRPETAFGVCGLSRKTYYRFLAAAREGLEPFASFDTEVACARDRFKSRALETVLAGDDKGESFGPAKAMLEILSRQFPKEWAPKVSVVLEEAESIWFDELQAVCTDPDVYARVCQEQDCSAVLIAVCERIARRDSEGEAPVPPGAEPAAVH